MADELLVLADAIIPDGRQLVGTASLIEVPSDGDVFDSDATVLAGADPPNLGDASLTPSRIYVTGNSQLRVSNSGIGDIQTLYTDGDLSDYELHVQTSFEAASVVSFGSDDIDQVRSRPARLIVGASADPDGILDDVDALADGDRVLWFLTEPEPVAVIDRDAAASAETGSPEASATAEAVDINRDASASAETGSPTASATAEAVDINRDAAGEAVSGSPTASATATADALLALADALIPDGRQLVGMASLIEIPADGDVYDSDATILAGADPPNLGAANLNPTRIYLTGNPQLRISQDGLGDIEATFAAGGAQEDYEIHVQTSATDVVTFGSDDIDSVRSTSARLLFGAEGDPDGVLDDLAALAAGDRALWFLTEPETVTNADAAASAESGSPTASATAEAQAVTNRDASASAETGSPTATATADAVSVVNRDAAASAETGSPTASATAEAQSITNADASATAESGSPEASATADAQTPPTDPPYHQGIRVTVDGGIVRPLTDSLRISRSLVDGSKLRMTMRGNRSDLTVAQDLAVTATDIASGVLLFSGHILDTDVVATAGPGELVDIRVDAVGSAQRLYTFRLTSSQARDVNNAATAGDQLDVLVTATGDRYSAGSVDSNVNRVEGVVAGDSVGKVLRGLGDVQRIDPDGEIGLLVVSTDSDSEATIERRHVLPTSHYTSSGDTTVRRVIAYGAPVNFSTTATLSGTDIGSGVIRPVAPIDPPDGIEVLALDRIIARGAITGKIELGDELTGKWNLNAERFEWSGSLTTSQSVLIEIHGKWRSEEVVEADDPPTLSIDRIIDTPITAGDRIRALAQAELDRQSLPVELMTLVMQFGVAGGLPRLTPAESVQVSQALQEELDVVRPVAADRWLVHGLDISQPGASQAAWQLLLSRRLPDYRERDFWDRERERAAGVEGVVSGLTSGAPQVALVIDPQTVKIGETVTIALGTYFSDPDNDMLTYEAESSNTAAVTVVISGSDLEITGVAAGTASITVTASDATLTAAQLVTATAVVNRAPVASNALPDRTLDAPETGINMASYFSDPDSDVLTYTAVSSDTDRVTASVSGSTLTLSQAGEKGDATITVTASDGVLSVSQDFTATVETLVVDIDLRAPDTISLTPPPRQAEWVVTKQIPTFWAGATRFIRKVTLENNRIRIEVSNTTADQYAAHDLPADWETREIAMRFRPVVTAAAINLQGPDFADNVVRDSSAHYDWEPPQPTKATFVVGGLISSLHGYSNQNVTLRLYR